MVRGFAWGGGVGRVNRMRSLSLSLSFSSLSLLSEAEAEVCPSLSEVAAMM